jgi:hypothetical protein
MAKRKAFLMRKMYYGVQHIHREQEREIINDKAEEKERRKKQKKTNWYAEQLSF